MKAEEKIEKAEIKRDELMKIGMSNFALRHFEKGAGTVILDHTPEQLLYTVNARVEDEEAYLNYAIDNKDWYYDFQDSLYPFCKYLILDNPTGAIASSTLITLENYQYLRSGYSSRTEKELPFLSRWLELPIKDRKPAKYLVLILYSREQLLAEHSGEKDFELPEDFDYGIVSIQAMDEPVVEPMTPYTMIRNHLGIKYGGNGEEIDETYLRSAAEYWNTHAIIK